ncbi:hypothetical protein KDA11_00355 [Candidatus Saccharibacteria bacterium]|nr:hypothetical protein [Candidatus Saccharibacteria bacterium]
MKSPKQDYNQSLTKVDDDEQLLAVIRRHPFGIIKLYVQSFIGLVASGGLIYYLLPEFISPENNTVAYSILGAVSLAVAGIMLFIVFVATIIYYQSQIIVTDKTITQTIQTSLFSKKTSQLAISSVEDVTANESGFFATMLDYGQLLIETAGEQENFHFEYCPHADHYAKLVLEARQQFMGRRESDYIEQRQAYISTNPNNS